MQRLPGAAQEQDLCFEHVESKDVLSHQLIIFHFSCQRSPLDVAEVPLEDLLANEDS